MGRQERIVQLLKVAGRCIHSGGRELHEAQEVEGLRCCEVEELPDRR